MTVNHLMIQNALRLKVLTLSTVTTLFSRASTATYYDINGFVQTAAINIIRNQHYLSGVLQPALVETASTNLVIQSDAINTGWTLATLSATNAYASHANVSFSRLTGLTSAATAKRSVTFTGDGTKAFSILVHTDGGAGVGYFSVRDTTAGTYRAVGGYTIDGAGAITAIAAVIGTAMGVVALGDGVYRVQFQTTSVTAANNHLVAAFDGQGASTLTSVQVAGVQVEDGALVSSLIPTTTATVTRAADIDALLAATASGYTRTSGSFLTEGFGTGMEIRETGFASNPISTITGVDPNGLSITVKDARGVETGAAGRRIFVGVPSDFAWENIKFTPTQGRPYIEEDYIPGPMSLNSLGALGNITAEPMYHLNVYVPQNSGIEADGGYADAILTLFAPSTTMTLANGDVLFVRADVAPYQGQRQQVSGNSVIPITIPLRLYTSNAI